MGAINICLWERAKSFQG